MNDPLLFAVLAISAVLAIAWVVYIYAIRKCVKLRVFSDAVVVYKGEQMRGLYFKDAWFRVCRGEETLEVFYPGKVSAHSKPIAAAQEIMSVINSRYIRPNLDEIESYLPLGTALQAASYTTSDVMLPEDEDDDEDQSFNSLVAQELVALVHGAAV